MPRIERKRSERKRSERKRSERLKCLERLDCMRSGSREDRLTGILFAGILLASLIFCALPGRAQAAGTSGYILPESSYSYLEQGTIEDFSSQLLSYARNEIYARNGRIFHSKELSLYFSSQYWYNGLYTEEEYQDAFLNEFEAANVKMLLDLERSRGEYILDEDGYSFEAVYQFLNRDLGEADAYYVDPNSSIFYDSSTRLLGTEEIQSLSTQELCYAKNEIYARHGYIFYSSELSDYFSQKNWYWGTVAASSFSSNVFNSTEISNIDSLTQAENARGGYALDQPGYSYEEIGSYSEKSTEKRVSSGDFIFYDSAIRSLSPDEIEGLSLQTLCYARNEIYARRGYVFQSQELRDYFGSRRWYYPTVPAANFSPAVFNSIETANIALLKKREYTLNPNGYQLY